MNNSRYLETHGASEHGENYSWRCYMIAKRWVALRLLRERALVREARQKMWEARAARRR